jgi:hypothetical protein
MFLVERSRVLDYHNTTERQQLQLVLPSGESQTAHSTFREQGVELHACAVYLVAQLN